MKQVKGGGSPQTAVGRFIIDMLHPLTLLWRFVYWFCIISAIYCMYIFFKNLYFGKKDSQLCLSFQIFTFMKKKTLRMFIRM